MADDPTTTAAHRLRFFRQGRNLHGKRVMGALCQGGSSDIWMHMTAYPRLRGWLGARRYLRSRFDDHVREATNGT